MADCSTEELQRLQQQLEHIKATYDEVGKVCGSLKVCGSHQKHSTRHQRGSKQAAGQCSSCCLWAS